MKTYYIIKTYERKYINGEDVERYRYFGKQGKLLGTDSKIYTENDIKNHGYSSYREALEAAWDLKKHSEGWSVVMTIITEKA